MCSKSYTSVLNTYIFFCIHTEAVSALHIAKTDLFHPSKRLCAQFKMHGKTSQCLISKTDSDNGKAKEMMLNNAVSPGDVCQMSNIWI